MSMGHSCYEGARDWDGESSPVAYSQAWSLAVSSAHFSWSSLSACSWDPPPASASQLLILSAGYPALMAFYMGTGDPNSNPCACVTSTFPILSHLPCPQAFLSEATCEVFCHSNKKEAKRMHREDCAHGLSCAVLQHLRQWIYSEKRFISATILMHSIPGQLAHCFWACGEEAHLFQAGNTQWSKPFTSWQTGSTNKRGSTEISQESKTSHWGLTSEVHHLLLVPSWDHTFHI